MRLRPSTIGSHVAFDSSTAHVRRGNFWSQPVMSTVVSHVIASMMKPSDSLASMVGSMANTMLLTNCPGE